MLFASDLFYKIKVFSVSNVCVLFPGVEMCWLLDQSLVWNLISHFFLFGSFFALGFAGQCFAPLSCDL